MDHKRHTHESNGEVGYECKGQLKQNQSKENKSTKEHAEANNITKQNIKGDKRKYNDELATAAEQAAKTGNIEDLYDLTKKLDGKRAKQERPVKDKKGQLEGEEEQRRRCRKSILKNC